MTIRNAIATIIGCTFLIAALGTMSGFFLGTFVPDYYRSVFVHGRDPDFDPVKMGVGHGLTQGIAGGVIVGLAVVALRCRYLNRTCAVESRADVQDMSHRSLSRTPTRLLLCCGVIVALAFCLCLGFVVGLVGGEMHAYHRRFLEEREIIEPVLANNPSFSRVGLDEYSGGAAYVSGIVPTPADLSELRSRVADAIGQHRLQEIMHVTIQKEKANGIRDR